LDAESVLFTRAFCFIHRRDAALPPNKWSVTFPAGFQAGRQSNQRLNRAPHLNFKIACGAGVVPTRSTAMLSSRWIEDNPRSGQITTRPAA
jgi:hypothetical protein